ncbi:MAG: LPS export ABC transporter periplasmic protein LptC [Bacteroidaceae bacterium]|nr:LPS export ABC transporter periplasmic protein LptC [Bacteroidaceae bacterium]
MNRYLPLVILLPLLMLACSEDEGNFAPAIEQRDSLPILKSRGVSTLISDSGIIRYKIIAEEWYIYDRRNPSFWAFEKGLFLEQFDEEYHVKAFVNADTAYYYDRQELWELRGRVLVKNLKGETFKTSLLYWDQKKHELYSDRYMEIKGETQELSGYDFRSDERMTRYSIHSSKGAFPMGEDKPVTPKPDAQTMAEYADTTQSPQTTVNTNPVPSQNPRNTNLNNRPQLPNNGTHTPASTPQPGHQVSKGNQNSNAAPNKPRTIKEINK